MSTIGIKGQLSCAPHDSWFCSRVSIFPNIQIKRHLLVPRTHDINNCYYYEFFWCHFTSVLLQILNLEINNLITHLVL